jgi:hypothetical protein
MKIEYSKSASCTKFGELPDHTKFIANLNAYIKFGDFFMDSNKVNAFNLDDEEFYYIPDDTMVTIPKAMKMVVELY